jgi:predicted house-cleaning NTP pyrophosphatase (Maf/HAM1 superfamily)
MLSELSESNHSVITAVIFVVPVENGDPHLVQFYEETFVKFTKLAPEMIDAYVSTGTPMYGV